jgi:hypothetical protein
MTQPASNFVAHDSTSHGLAHHETDPGWLVTARLAEQVTTDQLPSRAATAAHGQREL